MPDYKNYMQPGNIFIIDNRALHVLFGIKDGIMFSYEDMNDVVPQKNCSTSYIQPIYPVMLLENTKKKIRDVVSLNGYDSNSLFDQNILKKYIWKILSNEKIWLAGFDETDLRYMKKL